MSELSNRIKDAIKASGLSQREIEIKTGIPHSAIQRYASGDTDRVPIGRIEAIAKVTGTTAEYLLGWHKSGDEWSELFRNRLKNEIESQEFDMSVEECRETIYEADRIIDSPSPILLSDACSMADAFRFSIDEAVGLNFDSLPPKSKEFVNLFVQLTGEQQKMLIAQMKGLLNS